MAGKRRSSGGEPKSKAAKKSELPALPPDVKNTPVSKLIQEWVSLGCMLCSVLCICCVSCYWLNKGECS